MIDFLSAIMNIFLTSFFKELFILISGMSPSNNVQLPKEHIDALISAKVFHVNANNARDTDSICTPRAM